jgi:hypothetical protein
MWARILYREKVWGWSQEAVRKSFKRKGRKGLAKDAKKIAKLFATAER